MATVMITANAYDTDYDLHSESADSFIDAVEKAEKAGLEKIHSTISWTYETGPAEIELCKNGLRIVVFPVTDINDYIIGDITIREI